MMYKAVGDQSAIPCSIYRGGTSKGVLFLKKDLPEDLTERSRILLRVMGSPDARQIDGVGGADPLTSRVGIVDKDSSGIIRFQFALVHIKEPVVEFKGFCGNIISAVGPFAINEGLVECIEPLTTVKIVDVNTAIEVVAEVPVKQGKAQTTGNFAIAGVPGYGARIKLYFYNPALKINGGLLPTGRALELLKTSFGNIEVSLINWMAPAVFVRAQDLGLKGEETPQLLEKDPEALEKLEELRKLGAEAMGIACTGYLPKVVFVAPKQGTGNLSARMLALGKMHKAYAVSCGACTAVAAYIPGTVVHEMVSLKPAHHSIHIHHPLGVMETEVYFSSPLQVEKVCIYRTARCLMRGEVLV